MRTGRELLSAENELDQHTTTATATTDNNNNNDDDDGNGGDNGDSSGDPGPSTVHPATAAVATGETFGAVAATGEAATRGIISGSGGCLSVGESALAIPVAPHRRLRQSVLLAQKLLRKEGELETARKELVDIEQR